MRLLLPFFTCLVFFLGTACVQAGEIQVTVGNLLVSPGGSIDYVPIYIHTDSGTVNLAATSFEFEITNHGSTPVEFVNSPAPASDPTFSSPNYVFAGVSGDQMFGVPLGMATSASIFSGADEADNSPNFYVPLSTTPELLATLPVTTLTNAAPPLGDSFTVNLVPYSASDPITSFTDGSGNSLAVSPDSFTPAPVNVVPEPSTLTLLMIGVAGLTVGSRRRRKA